MTISIERRVLQLVAAECANHSREANGIKDYCCLEFTEDKRCVFATSEGQRCRYFEEAVLPLDAELQALYRADREARAHGDALTDRRARQVVTAVHAERVCAKCGKSFRPAGNRQRYCNICRRLIRNEQSRTRMRRRRGAGE